MSGKPTLALDASAARPGLGGDPALAEARFERCWPSPLDPARRYGIAGDLFYKIALREAADAPARRQDLRAEADLLRRCQGIPGIPGFVAWTQSDAARVLVLERLDAQPLNQLEIGWLRLGAVLLALAALVVRLAWRGVSHDDLRPENILLDRAGRIHLIDFDQASSGGFAACLARSLLGLRLACGPVSNSIWAPLRERVQTSLPPAVLRALKGARLGRRRACVAPLPPLPPLPPDAGPAARELHAAGATPPRRAPARPVRPWPITSSRGRVSCCRASGRGPRAGGASGGSRAIAGGACSSSAAISACCRPSCSRTPVRPRCSRSTAIR